MYYITICTKNRKCYLGEILDEEMILSEMGQVVYNEWLKTPERRPNMNLELGAFIIMPNHFHGILIIGDNDFNKQTEKPTQNGGRDAMHQNGRDAMHQNGRDAMHQNGRDAMHRVSTGECCNRFGPQSKNLASIIRGFKSSVTTHARKNDIVFAWQPRFYDHVIRSIDDYNRISNYIINNPANWHKDRHFILNNSQ
jgi:REP element-mobilizing transposase RayT